MKALRRHRDVNRWHKNLTPLLPILSAICPLTSAPNIPRAVNIEAKTEYCTLIEVEAKSKKVSKTQKFQRNLLEKTGSYIIVFELFFGGGANRVSISKLLNFFKSLLSLQIHWQGREATSRRLPFSWNFRFTYLF